MLLNMSVETTKHVDIEVELCKFLTGQFVDVNVLFGESRLNLLNEVVARFKLFKSTNIKLSVDFTGITNVKYLCEFVKEFTDKYEVDQCIFTDCVL